MAQPHNRLLWGVTRVVRVGDTGLEPVTPAV